MPRREWYLHGFFILLIAFCGLGACVAFLAKGSPIASGIMFAVTIAAEYGMARVLHKMRMLYQ